MAGTIGIGRLDKRVTVQYPTKVSDAMGGFTLTWTDHGTIWAAIMPVSANDMIQAAQQVMNITHRIRIRYRSKFKTSWRIKFGLRYFAVVSILNPNEHNEWLDLLCREAA